jgi:hypothetical protein
MMRSQSGDMGSRQNSILSEDMGGGGGGTTKNKKKK